MMHASVAAGVLAAVLAVSRPAAAQTSEETPPPATTAPLVDDQTLEAIRKRLAAEPALRDTMPRFQLEIVGRTWPTFAEYVKGTDFGITRIEPPTSGPRFGGSFGGGIDLLQLAAALRAKIQERQAQQIRARITQELMMLEALNAQRAAEGAEDEGAGKDKE